MTDTSGTMDYTYDPLYRLTGVTYPNSDEDIYTYDAMGNRLTKTHNGGAAIDYTYDDADQMTDVEGTSYDYDDNGNQAAAGSDTFEWDHENRLVATDINSVSSEYAYNGDGLRVSRTVGLDAVTYLWDENASLPVILEDSDGNRYVYGLDLLTRVNGASEEWYLYDGLGSTVQLADDDGDVTDSYTYDVFGAERSHSGSSGSEFTFTGEQNDPTGLEYLRARYYDQSTGRLISRDPLPFLMSYPYASGNPTNFVDPSGLCILELPCPGSSGETGYCSYGIFGDKNPLPDFGALFSDPDRAAKCALVAVTMVHVAIETNSRYSCAGSDAFLDPGRYRLQCAGDDLDALGLDLSANAFYHCYGAGLLNMKLDDPGFVTKALQIHEDSRPNDAANRRMDEHNNEWGKLFSEKANDAADLANRCAAAEAAGVLSTRAH